jgi:hypothetical protein
VGATDDTAGAYSIFRSGNTEPAIRFHCSAPRDHDRYYFAFCATDNRIIQYADSLLPFCLETDVQKSVFYPGRIGDFRNCTVSSEDTVT